MKRLSAKIMITLACAIIMLHAIVPHHHHDCAEEVGLVFETELNCHCSHQHQTHGCTNDCDDHHSDHPFDFCRLADMLSHLVLNTKADEHMMAQAVKAEAHDLMPDIIVPSGILLLTTDNGYHVYTGNNVPWTLPLPPFAGGLSLRAPPMCA